MRSRCTSGGAILVLLILVAYRVRFSLKVRSGEQELFTESNRSLETSFWFRSINYPSGKQEPGKGFICVYDGSVVTWNSTDSTLPASDCTDAGTMDSSENSGNSSNNMASSTLPTNLLSTSIYVLQPPSTPSLGEPLTQQAIDFWNGTLPDIQFRARMQANSANSTAQNKSVVNNDDDGMNADNLQQLPVWRLIYLRTDPTLLDREIFQGKEAWRWEYQVSWAAFDVNKEPITNATELQYINQALDDTLRLAVETGVWYEWIAGDVELDVALSFSTTNEQPSLAPSNYVPLTTLPVDKRAWDWTRYTGLGIFVATCVTTTVIMLIASWRQEQVRKALFWKDLKLSKEGVEELLRLDTGCHDIVMGAKVGHAQPNTSAFRELQFGDELATTHQETGTESSPRISHLDELARKSESANDVEVQSNETQEANG